MKTTLTKYKLFWPWQDEKEEAWLEDMSARGYHLSRVGLPYTYRFNKGEPRQYTYRMDYMYLDKKKTMEYLQVFQDAGWEYLGEMSNWRYWRKPVGAGETAEIFTDNESKIKKYQRVTLFLGFMLLILLMFGINLFSNSAPYDVVIINAIYFAGRVCYAILIPLYVVVVVRLLMRIKQLKRQAL
jgi:hypothetical protein